MADGAIWWTMLATVSKGKNISQMNNWRTFVPTLSNMLFNMYIHELFSFRPAVKLKLKSHMKSYLPSPWRLSSVPLSLQSGAKWGHEPKLFVFCGSKVVTHSDQSNLRDVTAWWRTETETLMSLKDRCLTVLFAGGSLEAACGWSDKRPQSLTSSPPWQNVKKKKSKEKKETFPFLANKEEISEQNVSANQRRGRSEEHVKQEGRCGYMHVCVILTLWSVCGSLY